MSRPIAALIVGTVLAVLAGCSSERPVRHIVVSGSRSMAPLLRDIGDRFEKEHPDIRVDVQPSIAEKGVNDTRNGLADIGMLARSLRPDENGLQPALIGRDGIAFLINRKNPVKSLDERQLVGLLTRHYTNWREVGGADRPVIVVNLAEGLAMRDVVLAYFALPATRFRVEAPVTSCEQAIRAVADHPDAVGYGCLGRSQTLAEKLNLRLLPLNGIAATLDNVRTGKYPLIRPLLLLTRDKPEGQLRKFIDYARSDEVRDLLEKHGFAPPQDN